MKSGFISIIGRPNAGKSTLMNHIVGRKVAIVSEKPQTTRNRIQGIYTSEKGQIVFVDTPGIHKPKHLLGEYMINVSTRSMQEVDIIYYITDVTRPFGGGERYIIDYLKRGSAPVFLLVNKIDLVEMKRAQEHIRDFKAYANFAETVLLSAMQGTNISALLDKTWSYLPEGPFYYPEDDYTDQPVSFQVAELIREKALWLTREEVPHSLAVDVEELRWPNGGKAYLRAIIYIERDSQKGIVIGKSGQMLKQIGAQARQELEELLDCPVYLDLWVKVKKDWRDSENNLRQLGYHF